MALTKDQIRDLAYARLLVLANSPDEDVSLKAIHELTTLGGLHADVSPRSITAQQTNNFTIPADKLESAVRALRQISGTPEDSAT